MHVLYWSESDELTAEPDFSVQMRHSWGIPTALTPGTAPDSPYFSLGEVIIRYLGAVGMKLTLCPMERVGFFSAWASKKRRGVRFGPIWECIWPSRIGPRVEAPAFMLINPYP
jgi:hypothetical protein